MYSQLLQKNYINFLIVSMIVGPAISFHKVYLAHIVIFIGLLNLVFRNQILDFLNTLKQYLLPTLLFIWFLTTVIWAENIQIATEYLIKYLCGFTALLLFAHYRKYSSNSKIHKLIFILFLSNLAISLLEVFTIFRLPISPVSKLLPYFKSEAFVATHYPYPEFYTNFPTSFFWHPNNVSFFTISFLPFALASKIKPVYKLLIWLISLLIIIKAGSKGVLVFFSLYTIYVIIKFSKKFQLKQTLYLLPIIFVLVASFFSLNKNQKLELNESFSTFENYLLSFPILYRVVFKDHDINNSFHYATSERFIYLIGALKEYKSAPIGGIGVGQLKNRIVQIDGSPKDLSTIHNHWIEILTTSGFIGLFLSIAWLLQIYYVNIKTKKYYRVENLESLSLMIFCVITMSSAIYFLPMWLLYGLYTMEDDQIIEQK